MRNVVGITGGTGFIGHRLVSLNRGNGDEVRILTRRPPQVPRTDGLSFYPGDLIASSTDNLRGFLSGVDILYHCAGEPSRIDRMYDLHVRGTEKLLSAAEGQVKHWIQLSSVGA